MTGSYTPFERPPEAQTLHSLIPRGLRRFFLQRVSSAKPINDDYQMLLTATLPDSFAYSISKFDFRWEADTASDIQLLAQTRLFNHIPGQPLGSVQTMAHPLLFFATDVNYVTAVDPDLTQFIAPFWSTHSGAVTWRLEARNFNDPAMAIGFFFCHVEFYEYDLVQAQRYWINTPVPVSIR